MISMINSHYLQSSTGLSESFQNFSMFQMAVFLTFKGKNRFLNVYIYKLLTLYFLPL